MIIDILQAEHGDAIFISYEEDGVNRNILIDGGPSKAYTFGTRPKRHGALKKKLDSLKEQEERIDLLILTHVDDDHIGGILKWFESSEFDADMISKVWFNAGALINEHFQQNFENDNSKKLKKFDSPDTSIGQGVTFEQMIFQNNLWDRKIIKMGDKQEEFGAKIIILSPSEDELKKLLIKWEIEAPDTLTSGRENDYDKTLEELLESDGFVEDKSIHNGSSIAFMLELQNKKILLLGDAFPSVVLQGIIDQGYSKDNPLQVDLVKLSHHGSKGNTTNELLEIIDCEKYVISTSGDRHALPNKRTLTRIINKKQNCKLYFNYPELIQKIFREEELQNYSFNTYSTEDLTI
ncbi:ComEC/Rec2 family competence protein [Sulfurovum sp.]|uniref:ComEC/Rec2 family competence protein n=1 Tax=Sulfurovum sp. TaxID=1969726 RepID=UPI0035656186